MNLEQISAELKKAMLEKDELRTTVLRGIISSIHNKEIELKAKQSELSEADILDVLKKEVKKRKEAQEMYLQGKRPELAEKENKEEKIISSFLPPQLSEEEIEKLISETLKDFPDASIKDFGKIVKAVVERAKGGCDGGTVSQIVKKYVK